MPNYNDNKLGMLSTDTKKASIFEEFLPNHLQFLPQLRVSQNHHHPAPSTINGVKGGADETIFSQSAD